VSRSASELPIEDEEWDFREVPDGRLGEALVYEYCRSESWITKIVKRGALDVGNAERYNVGAADVEVLKRKFKLDGARQRWATVLNKGSGKRDTQNWPRAV
jgi:hypothetical protein